MLFASNREWLDYKFALAFCTTTRERLGKCRKSVETKRPNCRRPCCASTIPLHRVTFDSQMLAIQNVVLADRSFVKVTKMALEILDVLGLLGKSYKNKIRNSEFRVILNNILDGFKRGFTAERLRYVFSEMIRVSARRSELQAKSRSYRRVRVTAGQTPRIRIEPPRKRTRIGFWCFYSKPPLKPS